MKIIIFLIPLVFLLTGCLKNEVQKPNIVQVTKQSKQYFIEDFIYKKEQIDFFEKQFSSILKSNNIEYLKKYANFYKKNSSYFLNGDIKADLLEKKVLRLNRLIDRNSHKELIKFAKTAHIRDAIKIYRKLAKQNNIFAQRQLADIFKYNNKPKSIYWYKKLIENNDIKSINDFAFANLHMVSPIEVAKPKEAVRLYEKLNELGEISGLVHLGNIYEHGYFKNDIPVDKQKSLNYFKKAAKYNYTPAQKKLAKIYLCEKCKDGRYDKQKGLRLLELLSAKGDNESKKILATIEVEDKRK